MQRAVRRVEFALGRFVDPNVSIGSSLLCVGLSGTFLCLVLSLLPKI